MHEQWGAAPKAPPSPFPVYSLPVLPYVLTVLLILLAVPTVVWFLTWAVVSAYARQPVAVER